MTPVQEIQLFLAAATKPLFSIYTLGANTRIICSEPPTPCLVIGNYQFDSKEEFTHLKYKQAGVCVQIDGCTVNVEPDLDAVVRRTKGVTGVLTITRPAPKKKASQGQLEILLISESLSVIFQVMRQMSGADE